MVAIWAAAIASASLAKRFFLRQMARRVRMGVAIAATPGTGKPRFPPCRAAVGRGTVRRMVEGRLDLVLALGFGAIVGGLLLPDAPLRQPFRLPPPRRCAAGRKVGAPKLFPTHPSICHIPKRLFDNQILLPPICKNGKGRLVAVRCFPKLTLFSLAAPKLNIRLLRA